MASTLESPSPLANHPDHAAFLRTILEHPHDDAPRLVFADWLDEQGEHERAEFIRIGIEEAALKKTCACFSCVYKRGGGQHRDGECDCRFLQRQSWRLAMKNSIDWFEFPCPPEMTIFDRGFVSLVQMECSAFMANAFALFAAHPITTVRLVDIEIQPDYFRWLIFGPDIEMWPDFYPGTFENLRPLPDDIFDRLRGDRLLSPKFVSFPTKPAAEAALSAACVAYGRSQAGLPPLDQA